jgi:hypothetical protein
MSSYHKENTTRLYNNDQLLNAVQKNNLPLLWELYETKHIGMHCAEVSHLLTTKNKWHIKLPLRFQGVTISERAN